LIILAGWRLLASGLRLPVLGEHRADPARLHSRPDPRPVRDLGLLKTLVTLANQKMDINLPCPDNFAI